jgi:predicted nucleic acid-binding protein
MAALWAYFDTSVLVKRYLNETASLQARALLRRHDLLSSSIINPELLSAFSRRRRSGELSEAQCNTLLRRARNDRLQWELIEVSSLVLDGAEELVQGAAVVRTLDAIHIASLMMFKTTAAIEIPLITADACQRDAARQVGVDVVWVG